ncbi:GerAB/ArcD/ProY family transporter [Cohnella hashimotonis]|uniref:GerAB/ArcD/ProY family transporter n=1 Tax=Cohnella hashimotonis TaxID=2826895 RepID=A0ABT6TK75_9BACL|nr:GerAB/ArcD/ProY family transporter [Cohnella hashimotonis]MDI4647233.1 GerAB/ArcD/ProY family transporter [Cohnella hashimotonis]
MRKRKEQITAGQMSVLITATTLGSSIVFIPHPLAQYSGQYAWMAALLAAGFGAVLLAAVLYLNRAHGGRSIMEYSVALFGRPLSGAMFFAVLLMLLFAVSAIVSGIGDFFSGVMMKETPAYIFNATSLFAAALTVRAGMKVTARMFVLLLTIMVAFISAVLVLAMPLYRSGMLLPIWRHEMARPLLHGFILTAGFPFGEVFLYALLIHLVPTAPGAAPWRGKLYKGYALASVLLIMAVVCSGMAFGPASDVFIYSLFKLASEIHIGDMMERTESIVGIALILGSYMKATVYLYMTNLIVKGWLPFKDDRAAVYPIALTCLFISLTLFDSPADFFSQVYVVWPFAVLTVGGAFIALHAGMTAIRGDRNRT